MNTASYRGALLNGRNFTNNGHSVRHRPRQQKEFGNRNGLPVDTIHVKSDKFTREFDLTFSLGRETNRIEVADILIQSGAIESYEDLREKVRTIGINNNALENGQVIVSGSHIFIF